MGHKKADVQNVEGANLEAEEGNLEGTSQGEHYYSTERVYLGGGGS